MQTPSLPPSLRSDHLDIKYAIKNDGRKISHYIISRLGTAGVQKGRFGRQKIEFPSKFAKFAGQIGIGLRLIFCIKDYFCAILSFSDMIDFFLRKKLKKLGPDALGDTLV